MNKLAYDIIVIALSILVAVVFMVSANKEINKSMEELNAHNRLKEKRKKIREAHPELFEESN